jgi:prepilin-type processing-associated H-X9-DG protein
MDGAFRGSSRLIRSFTIVELLTVVGIVMLLIAILVPALQFARRRVRDVGCTTNLRSVGQAIHSFVNAHDDYAAPCVRERDYYWDRGKQIGWDIETGRWANIPGGPGTIWRCPIGETPYVGNARALGLNCREMRPDWPIYRVGVRHWYEPAKLVLVYDVQPNLIGIRYKTTPGPMSGDISDELDGLWPRDTLFPVIPADFGPYGPHQGNEFGVLFADGHVACGTFPGESAMLWSGRRWWPDLPDSSESSEDLNKGGER